MIKCVHCGEVITGECIRLDKANKVYVHGFPCRSDYEDLIGKDSYKKYPDRNWIGTIEKDYPSSEVKQSVSITCHHCREEILGSSLCLDKDQLIFVHESSHLPHSEKDCCDEMPERNTKAWFKWPYRVLFLDIDDAYNLVRSSYTPSESTIDWDNRICIFCKTVITGNSFVVDNDNNLQCCDSCHEERMVLTEDGYKISLDPSFKNTKSIKEVTSIPHPTDSKSVGRPSLGITKKVSITLPQEVWDLFEKVSASDQHGSKSAYLRTLIEGDLGNNY